MSIEYSVICLERFVTANTRQMLPTTTHPKCSIDANWMSLMIHAERRIYTHYTLVGTSEWRTLDAWRLCQTHCAATQSRWAFCLFIPVIGQSQAIPLRFQNNIEFWLTVVGSTCRSPMQFTFIRAMHLSVQLNLIPDCRIRHITTRSVGRMEARRIFYST